MSKISTPSNYSVHSQNENAALRGQLQPAKKTLKNILEFAAAYRVDTTTRGEYLEYFLN